MSELINQLKQTITLDSQNKLLINDNIIKIKEFNQNAKLKSVTLKHKNSFDNIFTFSLDLDNRNKLSYYINRKNFNKGCDGIIILEKNNTVYVIICELKSGKPKKVDYKNQIFSSEAFVYYIFEALKIFNLTSYSKEELNIIRVLFDTENYSKGKSNPRDNKFKKIHDKILKCDCMEGEDNIFHLNQILDSAGY